MNYLVENWTWNSEVLTWFATVFLQVTLLATLVLTCARFAKKDAALRHSVLAIGLLLIAISPISAYFVQRAGFGVAVSAGPRTVVPNDKAANSLAAVFEEPSQEAANEPSSSAVVGSDEFTAEQKTYQPNSLARNTAPFLGSSSGNAYRDESLGDRGQLTESAMNSGSSVFGAGIVWRLILSCVLLIWILGSIVMSLRWLVAWIRLTQILRRAAAAESIEVEQSYLAACKVVGCERGIARLMVSSHLATPIVAGILKPTIVLPAFLCDKVTSQQMVDILAHELAHVVRRDQNYLILQNLTRTIFWVHPLVSMVCRQLTRACEEICDNYVLRHNDTTAYSRTLLVVAQLGMGRMNPAGAIGVVGSGWSLTDRIAGLLDGRRVVETRLVGRSKVAIGILASVFSLALLASIKFSEKLAVAQQPPEQAPAVQTAKENDWIRGTGDNMEFRLRGRLIGGLEGNPVEPKIEARIIESNKSFPATVVGARYEVWIPIKEIKWFSLSIMGNSSDSRRAAQKIRTSELRSAMINGVDLTFQRVTRSVNFHVRHKGENVAGAKVQVTTGVSVSFQPLLQTDANGLVSVGLLPGESPAAVTAWTDSGLLGGFQFWQKPERDPKASGYEIDMVECENRVVQAVDEAGLPVEGVRLRLEVATPEPYCNYFGNPDGCEVVTNANGLAEYRWFPKLKEVFHYAELEDPSWILQSQSNTDDRVEIVLTRPAERVRLESSVSRGGEFLGGLLVEAYSFQGETEGRSDVHYAMVDHDGKFAFDALPNSTYCIFVIDDRFVSESSVVTPRDPVTGALNSTHLTAIDGHPVTIAVTTGSSRRPLSNQSVSLSYKYPYSWNENGKRRNGSTGRQTFTTTDAQGLATVFAPLGSLEASVYSSSWRAEAETIVKPGTKNRIELHRANDTPVAAVGRLIVPPKSSVDMTKVKILVHAIDRASSDELTPTLDKSGTFRFSTKASTIGCFANTEDGSFAGSALITDISQPFELALQPTAYLNGQLLDAEGKAIANKTVSAHPVIENRAAQITTYGFSTTMNAPRAEAKTDADGKYRIGPLPRLTKIYLRCKTNHSSQNNDEHSLGDYYIELDEQRPPAVHRIGEAPSSAPKLSAQQRIDSELRDAKLGGFHAMTILADYSDSLCSTFVQEQLMDYNRNIKVSGFIQIRYKTGKEANPRTLQFLKEHQWPFPPPGSIVAIAMDAEGKELGRITLDVKAANAKDEAAKFVETHQPPTVDSRQKWNEAFTLAKKTNRRVWVRISQRYCGPCFLLNRWLDEHREVLEKEFVMLKIDNVRDENGQEITDEITGGHLVGVPFFAFYDADEKMLIDSRGPTGNIGFMSGYESKRHFRKMLGKVRQVLTADDVDKIVSSLED